MQPESRRRHVGGGGRLLDHVEALVRVHLEHPVSLLGSVRDLLCEHLGPAGAGPGRDRGGVSHLLSHQLIGRHFQVLAHDVVQRHPQGQVEVVVEEVERVAPDQRLDHAVGDIGVVLVVAVAHQAVVGVHFHDYVLVHIVHAHAPGVVVVARGQGHGHGDYLDVGDLHGCACLRFPFG